MRVRVFAGLAALPSLVAFACGDRTELALLVSERVDAAVDRASPDTAPLLDGLPARDTAPLEDTGFATDTRAPRDAATCPISGLTAYLIADDGALYRFDPETLAATPLGSPPCPTGAPPYTLTAASSGMVYVLHEDWSIYEVDPSALTCTKTPYVPGQLGLGGDDTLTVCPGDGGESLYVYGQNGSGQTVLAKSDLVTFTLSEVGVVTPTPPEFPLDVRADPFGRIYGLGSGGTFVEIDPRTAAVVSQVKTGFGGGGSWALLTYNDGVYFFAGGAVSRYDVTTRALTSLGNLGFSVVGASAAPCLH